MEHLKKKKEELELVDTQKITKSIMYGNQTFFEFGNKPGKQSEWVLSEPTTVRGSPYISTTTGSKVVTPEEKIKVFEDFDRMLYSSTKPLAADCDTFLSTLNLQILNEAHREALYTPILVDEVYEAIRDLKQNKVAGPHGFMAEFYKKFKFQLGLQHHQLFLSCTDAAKIPDSWKNTKVVLIPKSGKDPTHPSLYHPISLLNIDYKILSLILAARVSKILNCYVHDKSGFLKGRYLMNNTRRVQNLIKYVN